MLHETGFFAIIQQSSSENAFGMVIRINPEHEIFKGHFPDLPIVPGVCLLQIVREAVEIQLNKKQNIREVNNMKFLAPYNPMEQDTTMLSVSYVQEADLLKISASLTGDAVTFFKLSAVFHDAN